MITLPTPKCSQLYVSMPQYQTNWRTQQIENIQNFSVKMYDIYLCETRIVPSEWEQWDLQYIGRTNALVNENVLNSQAFDIAFVANS